MAKRKTQSLEAVANRWAERGTLPEGYEDLLEDFKARVRSAQVKAAVSVNSESSREPPLVKNRGPQAA